MPIQQFVLDSPGGSVMAADVDHELCRAFPSSAAPSAEHSSHQQHNHNECLLCAGNALPVHFDNFASAAIELSEWQRSNDFISFYHTSENIIKTGLSPRPPPV